MSDLVFSIIMLTTFASTFVFNGLYVRWQTGSGREKKELLQDQETLPTASTEKEG